MNKHEAYRTVLAAFIKEAATNGTAEPTVKKPTVPGGTAPAVAGIKPRAYKQGITEGPTIDTSKTPKAMVPQLPLTPKIDTKLAGQVIAVLEKASAGLVGGVQNPVQKPGWTPPKPHEPFQIKNPQLPPTTPGKLAVPSAQATPAMTPTAPAKLPMTLTAGLDQVIEKLSACGAMTKKKKKSKVTKMAGVHVATRDAKSKATQEETEPEVIKLESASDTPPKKAPEKKPEPKISENEVEKEAGPARGGYELIKGLIGSAGGGTRRALEAGLKGLTAKGPAMAGAAAGAAKAAPGALRKYWPLAAVPAALGAGLWGKNKIEQTVPEQKATAATWSPSFGQRAGWFLGDVGGKGMRGVGDLLNALGMSGAKESLYGWSEDPTISKVVGGGGLTLGSILAIMLLKRLLGGGRSED